MLLIEYQKNQNPSAKNQVKRQAVHFISWLQFMSFLMKLTFSTTDTSAAANSNWSTFSSTGGAAAGENDESKYNLTVPLRPTSTSLTTATRQTDFHTEHQHKQFQRRFIATYDQQHSKSKEIISDSEQARYLATYACRFVNLTDLEFRAAR